MAVLEMALGALLPPGACSSHRTYLNIPSGSYPLTLSPIIFRNVSSHFSWNPSSKLQKRRRGPGGVSVGEVRLTRASSGADQEGESERNFLPPDFLYLGKLAAGCVAGAIVVKYGSILVPSITRPNLNQALLMISTPVFVSVVLLTLAGVKRLDKVEDQQ